MQSTRVGIDINNRKNGRLSNGITDVNPDAKSNEFVIKFGKDSKEFVTACQIKMRNDVYRTIQRIDSFIRPLKAKYIQDNTKMLVEPIPKSNLVNVRKAAENAKGIRKNLFFEYSRYR